MKSASWMRLIVLAGVVVFLAACHPTIDLARLTTTKFDSPLPTVADPAGSIRSYRATWQSETRYDQANGLTPPGILAFTYTWQRTAGQYGYDAHAVTTLVDPQAGTPGVMDESYAVGDFVFTQNWNGWTVAERAPGLDPLRASLVSAQGTLPNIESVAQLGSLPLAALVGQSVVIDEEELSGIPATHYRLTDFPVMTDTVRVKLGGAPHTPLAVHSAQLDIWLTTSARLPLQYTFQAEGQAEVSAGSNALVAFTLQEHYRITAINDINMAVAVPADVLAAVEAQLQALKRP